MASTLNAIGRKERAKRAHRNAARVVADPASASGQVPQMLGLEKMMAGSEPHLISGKPFGVDGQLDIDPAKLLRKVVSAVISAGHAADLYEFPDVLAFFNARLPPSDELADRH